MARTAGKKQAPAKTEDDDDTEGWDDAVVETEGEDGSGSNLRLRDWRDVERYREMRELRHLVDDDYGLEEIFHVPLKARADVPPRAAARLTPAEAARAKAAARAAAKAAAAPAKVRPAPKAAKPHKKPAAKPAPAAAKVKAKAKRR